MAASTEKYLRQICCGSGNLSNSFIEGKTSSKKPIPHANFTSSFSGDGLEARGKGPGKRQDACFIRSQSHRQSSVRLSRWRGARFHSASSRMNGILHLRHPSVQNGRATRRDQSNALPRECHWLRQCNGSVRLCFVKRPENKGQAGLRRRNTGGASGTQELCRRDVSAQKKTPGRIRAFFISVSSKRAA